MIVALNLPNYGTLGQRGDIVAIAEAAEELGYESVWTTDHVLVPNHLPADFFSRMLESLVTLSFIAGYTETIGIGTGILVLPQRDPILVAKQAATLQHLSGGRFSLAVAVGYIEQEYNFLRAPFAQRGTRLDEYLGVMRQLLEAEHPSFHGETITFDDVYFSPRPDKPIPLFIGGGSTASLRRAATMGDGWYALKQTPQQISSSLASISAYELRPGFQTSLRVATRIDGALPHQLASETLQGTATEIAHAVNAFARAGVDRFVIEPLANDLNDFRSQMAKFMTDVAPRMT